MPLGLCLLPLAVLPAQAHALTAEEAPRLLPLLQLYSRALSDAPCEASRYGSSAVIYPFTESDDDVESVAAGVVQAKRDLPGATVLLTDGEGGGLDAPIRHLSSASRLLYTLESINVSGVKRLPSPKRATDTLNEAENVVRRQASCTRCTRYDQARSVHPLRPLRTLHLPVCAAASRRMCRRCSSSHHPSTCRARCSRRSARSSGCAARPRRRACTCSPSRAAAPEGRGGARRPRTRSEPAAGREPSSFLGSSIVSSRTQPKATSSARPRRSRCWTSGTATRSANRSWRPRPRRPPRHKTSTSRAAQLCTVAKKGSATTERLYI